MCHIRQIIGLVLTSGVPSILACFWDEIAKLRSQLKLLLRAADLSVDGSREELLNRLREEVVLDVEHEWVVNKLHIEAPIREDATIVERHGEPVIFPLTGF